MALLRRCCRPRPRFATAAQASNFAMGPKRSCYPEPALVWMTTRSTKIGAPPSSFHLRSVQLLRVFALALQWAHTRDASGSGRPIAHRVFTSAFTPNSTASGRLGEQGVIAATPDVDAGWNLRTALAPGSRRPFDDLPPYRTPQPLGGMRPLRELEALLCRYSDAGDLQTVADGVPAVCGSQLNLWDTI